MGELVAHLLAHRQRIPNRAIIACLALAQLAPKPTERFTAERLMEVLEISNQPYLSHLLRELKRHDLVEYERGDCAEPGYLFFRVGPLRREVRR
jgi:DNA-binding IscR family transcriptional regulator